MEMSSKVRYFVFFSFLQNYHFDKQLNLNMYDITSINKFWWICLFSFSFFKESSKQEKNKQKDNDTYLLYISFCYTLSPFFFSSFFFSFTCFISFTKVIFLPIMVVVVVVIIISVIFTITSIHIYNVWNFSLSFILISISTYIIY